MADTDICCKVEPQEMIDRLNKLDTAARITKNSFFTIAYQVYWFYQTKTYDAVGDYATIVDFTKKRYGMSKAYTYQYINVVGRFGEADPNTGYIERLQDKYMDYSSTALVVMSSMTDEQLARCTPSMKVKDLKAILIDADLVPDEDFEPVQQEAAPQNSIYTDSSGSSYRHQQLLYMLTDADDVSKYGKAILSDIKKSLSQKDGVQFRVSIRLEW